MRTWKQHSSDFISFHRVEVLCGLLRPWLNIDRCRSVMIQTTISFNPVFTYHLDSIFFSESEASFTMHFAAILLKYNPFIKNFKKWR